MSKKERLSLSPRPNSLLHAIPRSEWMRFLDDARRFQNWKSHADMISDRYNVQVGRARYYRARSWLEERESVIKRMEVINTKSDGRELSCCPSEFISLYSEMAELKKSIEKIKRDQSFIASEIRNIGAARLDAFVMYMDMRNLNRVLRNSAFVSDAFSMTEDIPYPGKRKAPIATIHEYLSKLEKKTRKRLDTFLHDGLTKRFDRKDLSDAELFMLRIRLMWGCEIVRELERDTQIPLTNDEKAALDVTVRGIDPDVLFIDLWSNIGTNWLYDFAAIIYKYGKLPTQHTQTISIAHALNMLQRIKESRQ